MDLHLSKKTFIVTGASSGLGRASAEALLAEGANVVAVARRRDVLEDWRREAGEGLAIVEGDIAHPQTSVDAVSTALSTFGSLDGALVSVGGPPKGGVVDNTDEEWLAAFDSVFLGALRVTREVVASATSAPVIGFVLSTSVKAPLPSMAISNGLRPGLAMLIKQLGDELGPQGGRSFGLMPGQIDTDRLQWLHSQSGDFDATRQAAEAGIPMRRVGTPAEFGSVAAFLLSPAAAYISGCVIPVDGGATRAL